MTKKTLNEYLYMDDNKRWHLIGPYQVYVTES
jgi:hypothetical protein